MELALVSLAAIVARLPQSLRVRLGDLLGWLAGSVLRIRRTLVEAAMQRASIADVRAHARAMYRGLGRSLVELLWIAGSARREAGASVAIDAETVTALDAALARGPVVLFASHTGNWELAAAAAATLLAERGRALFVVAKRMHARGVDAFLARLRARLGLRIVAPHGALGEACLALDRGDVVAMPIDQVPDAPRHGLQVGFLGQTCLADRAPATLAYRARATVLVVAANASGTVRLLATMTPPARTERGAPANETAASSPHGSASTPARTWIDATTTHATAALEAFVLHQPAAWLWLHRRWRLVATREAG